MNKLFALLSLAVLMLGCTGVTQAGGCPDGSEPVKSVSADGTYFVYNCGGASSSSVTNSKAGTVNVSVNESTSSGDWFSTDGDVMWTPHFAKYQLVFTDISKSYTAGNFAIADFDNDGIDDFFVLTNPKMPGVRHDLVGPGCDTSKGACYSKAGSISAFKVEKTGNSYKAIDVTGLLLSNNPVELNGTDSTDLHVADFNGDGKVDVFATDTTSIDGDWHGKNDVYFLSNEGPGWTEATSTHITGAAVKRGEGLINFSHGSSVGDIDGDGDIDIIVTSIVWTGGNGSNQNGEIFCYVNQGDGHMKVRRCGNQWGKTAVLGDMDNDGDLDIVFGSENLASIKVWDKWNRVPGCFGKSRCNGAFNGILLNDGTGNFYERGFSFPEIKSSTGHVYYSVPTISVADLDGDGDLDVVRTSVGQVYAGSGMTIEENLGNGKFKTVFYSEFCATPKTIEAWPRQEGSSFNCWVSDYKFGDFNEDGLIDIYLDGHDANNSDVVKDGAIYMSNGKFSYDILLPSPLGRGSGMSPVDEDYPLVELKIVKNIKRKIAYEPTKSEQDVEDEIAAFEAELEAELDALIVK